MDMFFKELASLSNLHILEIISISIPLLTAVSQIIVQISSYKNHKQVRIHSIYKNTKYIDVFIGIKYSILVIGVGIFIFMLSKSMFENSLPVLQIILLTNIVAYQLIGNTPKKFVSTDYITLKVLDFRMTRRRLILQSFINSSYLAYGINSISSMDGALFYFGFINLVILLFLLPYYAYLVVEYFASDCPIIKYELRDKNGERYTSDILFENERSYIIAIDWHSPRKTRSYLEIRKEDIQTISERVSLYRVSSYK